MQTDFHSVHMAYDFATLSHSDFEELARELVGRELGVRFEAFPEGRDDGIDGRHAAADGAIILQAKHYHRSGFSKLRSRMVKERAAIDRLAPKRYILVTSAALSPRNKASLAEIVGRSVLRTGDIIGPEDLNALLRKYGEIERAFHKLWGTSTTVLESVVSSAVGKGLVKTDSFLADAAAVATLRTHAREDVHAKVSSAHLALKFDPAVYVKRALEDEVGTWLAAPRSSVSTCFLILAPAGSGKTNLLCKLAEESSANRPTVLLIGSQLRIDARHGLWAEVFEACGVSIAPAQSRADLVRIVHDLARCSGGGFTIVLDAINEHSDPVALKHELSTFLTECEQADVHLLLSCRDYYWGLFEAGWWSHFVRFHEDDRKSTRRVLGNFTPEEASQAFKCYFDRYGVSAQPQGNALEQFRHPLLLRFFCETYRGETLGRLRDIRLKDLFDTYWDRKLGSIAERMIDQGTLGVLPELKRHVARCILDIAGHMLAHNVRAISVATAQHLSRSDMLPTQLSAPYGRILDEHIILEELDAWRTTETTLVAFVFEEFMEYAMARSMLDHWHSSAVEKIYAGVLRITERYGDFSQVLGVVLYLALMLKEERGIALWSTLIDRGPEWERVIIEAFRRLPTDQIDDGVFEAVIDLLRARHSSTRIEALELLKFGRLRRIPPPTLVAAVGELVTSDDLRIRRRALLALGYCPRSFAIPLIEKAVTTPIHRKTHAYEVAKNAATSLVKLGGRDALRVIVLMFGGFWHANNVGGIVARFAEENLAAIYEMLSSDDVVLRLGAVRILRYVPSQQVVDRLEAVLADMRREPPSWYYKDLPEWVRVSGGYFLHAPLELNGRKSEHREIESAKSVVRETRTIVGWGEQAQTYRRLVDALIEHPDRNRLLEAIPTLEYDPETATKLLQAGLEHRDPNRWKVRNGRWGILIAPRGRRGRDISPEDRRDLARLLELKAEAIPHDGVHVHTSSRFRDYWREYIYRCWGWEPAIKGYNDLGFD